VSSAIPRRRRPGTAIERDRDSDQSQKAAKRAARTSSGVPHSRCGSHYGGVLPEKITIYGGSLVRLYGHDSERLSREIRRVVLHEVAHHFGISDERLFEMERY
jgi:predicted Zn-dependent protease with MMP-like domain